MGATLNTAGDTAVGDAVNNGGVPTRLDQVEPVDYQLPAAGNIDPLDLMLDGIEEVKKDDGESLNPNATCKATHPAAYHSDQCATANRQGLPETAKDKCTDALDLKGDPCVYNPIGDESSKVNILYPICGGTGGIILCVCGFGACCKDCKLCKEKKEKTPMSQVQ